MRAHAKDAQILSTIWTRTQEANIWQRLDEQEDVKLCREAEVELKDPGFQDPRCRHPLLTQSFQAPHPLSLANWGKSKFYSARTIWRWTYPFMRENYLFFAWSISMRRVAWGAFPCMCLKYKKSSPRWAIDLKTHRDHWGFRDLFGFYLSSGIWANSWLYFSWK